MLKNKKELLNASVILLAIVTVIVYIFACFSTAADKPKESDSVQSQASTDTTSIPSSALESMPYPEYEWTPNPAEIEAIAKTLYRECRGVKSTTEQAAVVWCILNRVKSSYYPNTVIEVLEQPSQFAYDVDAPVWQSLADLAVDVLTRYHREQMGENNVGRVLPAEYLYFVGDGVHNYFTIEWRSKNYWTWDMETPYED